MMMMMSFISVSATGTTAVNVDNCAIISIAIFSVSSESTAAVTPPPIDGGSTIGTILSLLLFLLFLLI